MIFLRKNFDKILLFLQVTLLLLLGGVGLLIVNRTAELSNAGSVIRLIGDVSVDMQVLVKRELNNDPEDRGRVEQLRKEVFILLDNLTRDGQDKNLQKLDDQIYQEELSRLYMLCRKVEAMIDVYRQSRGLNAIHLFILSIWHHDQSKRTLAAAEQYSLHLTHQIRGYEMVELALFLMLLATMPIQYYRIKR